MSEDDRELDVRLLERFGLVPAATPLADAGDLANRGGAVGDLARAEWARLAEESGAYVRDEDGLLVRDVGVALPRIRQEPDPALSAAELAQRGEAYLAYACGDADLADRQHMLREYWAPRWAREKASA